jgi:SAM-dependent methyltransferase
MPEELASFDRRATRGEPSYVWRAGQERRFRQVRHWAPLEGRCVLDVGCGLGMYTAAFLRETPHVFGVEIERERALEARERAAGIVQTPGERLPFPDATFDVVFSHEVLEHVADDRACVAEMVRVTRTGGRIVIFVPNRLYPFETHGIFWRGVSPSVPSTTRASFPATTISLPAPLPWEKVCALSPTPSSAPLCVPLAFRIYW